MVWKNKKETRQNLSKWNLAIKVYRLKLSMHMTVTTKSLSNLHIPITLHDTTAKRADKKLFTWEIK